MCVWEGGRVEVGAQVMAVCDGKKDFPGMDEGLVGHMMLGSGCRDQCGDLHQGLASS